MKWHYMAQYEIISSPKTIRNIRCLDLFTSHNILYCNVAANVKWETGVAVQFNNIPLAMAFLRFTNPQRNATQWMPFIPTWLLVWLYWCPNQALINWIERRICMNHDTTSESCVPIKFYMSIVMCVNDNVFLHIYILWCLVLVWSTGMNFGFPVDDISVQGLTFHPKN